MARIAGVDLPNNKRGEIGLTYIFGIGRSSAKKILEELGIDVNIKVKDWTDDQITAIRSKIANEYKIEGELRSAVQMNIKRLMDIGCYRGIRHRLGLPVRGQSTKNNARTRKGKKKTVANKKKASGDINVIYPLDAMLKEKKDHHDHFLYYRTDTHWNSHGAFIAYKELMAVIQKDYPDFKPLTDEDFYLTKSNPEPGCDEDFNGPGVEGDLLRMFPGRTITDLEIKNNYVDKLVLKEGTFKYKFLKFAGEER